MGTLIRVLVLVGIGWGVYHYFGDEFAGSSESKSNSPVVTDEIVREINADLPMSLEGGELTWDAFEVRPLLAVFKYTLTNLSKSEIGPVYFDAKTHQRFTQEVCKTKGIEPLIKQDYAFRMSFYDQNGEFLQHIHADSSECRHITY